MMSKQPGVMAPPTLYEQAAGPGLMSPTSSAPHPPISLRAFFWSIAAVLGAIEICAQNLS
jgi:hypothetical protein